MELVAFLLTAYLFALPHYWKPGPPRGGPGVVGRWASRRRERRRAAKEQRRAELAMRIAERRAELLARERLRRVRLQMARGSAGNASPQQAREALRGRGGRANDLDERWF